jgi:hypothetical protein
MSVDEDDKLVGEFHQGQATSRRDGYRADNPHAEGTDRHAAWLAGFDYEEGPRYVVRPRPNGGTMVAAFERAFHVE